MELEHVVVWDGTRSGPVGSPSANRDLLFWEPGYAEEEDQPVLRPTTYLSVSRVEHIAQRQADVLAAMGAEWTQVCMIARRCDRSHYAINRALRVLVQAGRVEMQILTAHQFSRGVRWYRRVVT